MHAVSWKKALRLVLAFALLLVFLNLCVAVLYGLLRTDHSSMFPSSIEDVLVRDRARLNYWQTELTQDQLPLTRTVVITTQPSTVTVELNLWIPTKTSLEFAFEGGATNDSTFARAAFGSLWLEREQLIDFNRLLGPLTWSQEADGQLIHIYDRAVLAIEGTLHGGIAGGVPVAGPDEVILHSQDMGIVSLFPTPLESSSQTVIVTRKAYGDTPAEVGWELTALTSVATAPTQPSSQDMLSRLGEFNAPFLLNLVAAVLRVLPILIFWWLVKHDPRNKPAFALSLANTLTGVLVFHFWLNSVNSIFFLMSLVQSVRSSLLPLDLPQVLDNSIYAVVLTFPVMLGLLVPTWLLKHAGASTSLLQRRVLRWLKIVSILLLLAGLVVGIIYATGALVGGALDVAGPFAIVTSLIWLGLSALYRVVDRKSFAFDLTALATVLIVILVLLAAWLNTPDTQAYQSIVWLIVTIGFGAALIWTFIKVVRAQFQRTSVRLLAPRWLTRLIVAVLILAAVPLYAVFDAGVISPEWYDPITFAYALDGLILLLWVAGALWLMYDAGRRGQRMRAFTRVVGILAASTVLFNPGIQWLYVPIGFLLGFMALLRLARPARWWLKIAPLLEPVFTARVQLLDQVLDVNAAESAYTEYRKQRRDKLASGEITFEQYEGQLDKARRDLDQLRAKDTVAGQPVKDVALTFGPHRSAWANGVHGARYSLIFALPWLALYLRDFLADSASPFLFVTLASNLGIVLTQWLGLGFLFGYFYPYLRGQNGLTKGLALFLVTTLPTLPAVLLRGASIDQWQAHLFWMLQMFGQCMLLGLVAFDYATLRQGRYDWQMLFEVHGLRTIGVSVSSIIVAVGAAITTLLTTQATGLVTNVLTFILPQIQNLPPNILPK